MSIIALAERATAQNATRGARPAGKPHLMTAYELNKAVHHLYIDRDAALAFKSGDTSVLDRFNLTAAERAAVEAHDFVALWGMHVHPVLMFHLAAVLYPREWYVNNVAPRLKGIPNVWGEYYSLAA
jgi:hypothetical protein